jgi:hypothetical protein
LGDILSYLAELCTQLGLSLEVVAARNTEKLRGRQARAMLGGDGTAVMRASERRIDGFALRCTDSPNSAHAA